MRIFNRIRRKLLDELKIKSYLLYALGEILLLVVGILLALQINNWNQEGKSLAEEGEILQSLQQNFLSNQIEISGALHEYASTLAITNLRISNTGPAAKVPGEQVLDSLTKIDYVHLSFIFGGSTPALTQEKSTMLSSRKLAIELNRFPVQYLRYKEQEANMNRIADELRSLHQNYASILQEDPAGQTSLQAGKRTHPSDYTGWLRDRATQNRSVESKWKIVQAVAELEHLKADNRRVLKLIGEELERF